MRYLLLIALLAIFSGCAIVRVPIKAAKVTVKTAATGVKLVGKGAKAVVD